MKLEAMPDAASPSAVAISAAVVDPFRWIRTFWARLLDVSRRPPRRLRLCESLPLGDRRFVAVVEYEQARFLLGGTPSSLVLLARLGSDASQVNILDKNTPSGNPEARL